MASFPPIFEVIIKSVLKPPCSHLGVWFWGSFPVMLFWWTLKFSESPKRWVHADLLGSEPSQVIHFVPGSGDADGFLSYRTWPTFWNFGEKGATCNWATVTKNFTFGNLAHKAFPFASCGIIDSRFDAWMLRETPWAFGSTSTEYVHDYLGNTMWKPNKNLPQHTPKKKSWFLDHWIFFCWSPVGLRDQYLKRGQICTGHTVAPATWIQIWRHAAPGAQFPRFTNLRFTVLNLKLCHSESQVLPYLRYVLTRVRAHDTSIQPKLPR